MNRYSRYGVNVGEADRGISRLVDRIKGTWPAAGFGAVRLDIGYFANVIDFDGIGLAVTTDGVGSKTMICEMMMQYSTIGIDCVAMNVNDLICVGATPVSMLDYIGVERAEEWVLDEIGIGLAEGARQAGISISGGEVSQLGDILDGFDLVGTAVGKVALDQIITGHDTEPGDIVIGIASNGIHSNGLSFARKVLFAEALLDPFDENLVPELDGVRLGEELLRPTFIYVNDVKAILDAVPVRALINITGDGLLNLLRVNRADIGFVLDLLPKPPAIFNVIQRVGMVDRATMYEVFNMGIGFCVVVEPRFAPLVMEVLQERGREAWVLGKAVYDSERGLYMTRRVDLDGPLDLVGHGKHFTAVSHMALPS